MIGLVPACENMPDGRALKPGDVVTSMSGQTIEVLNTDAEGRLILCDALTYAKRFAPAAVIDIATLTGACVVALGGVRSGPVLAATTRSAERRSTAGEASLDRCWRMPLDDDYAEGLEDQFRRRRQRGRPRAAAPSRRPSSCSASPATIPGRTWTSPARRGRAVPPRARPAGPWGCC